MGSPRSCSSSDGENPMSVSIFLSFFFVSLCEFVEYVNWVCSVSNAFQLGFCQLGLDVVALLGWCVLVYWGLIVHSRSEVRGERKPNKKILFCFTTFIRTIENLQQYEHKWYNFGTYATSDGSYFLYLVWDMCQIFSI